MTACLAARLVVSAYSVRILDMDMETVESTRAM